MLSYVDGTNFVTKHTVMRHLSGKAHNIATEAEKSKPDNDCVILPGSSGYSQPKVTTAIEKSSHDAYKKMFLTAYEMAMQPSMPFRHFYTLIKCQRTNGVRLIQGKDNHHAAAEFVQYLADEVREKLTQHLDKSNFVSILSDGSQARKVKSEKELVLTHVIKNGVPTYLVSSLLEMSR